MNFLSCELFKLNCHMKPVVCRYLILVSAIVLFTVVLSPLSFRWFQQPNFYQATIPIVSNPQHGVRKHKFLEVPQIIWGLNNQKIAFARACLTARFLNRTLLMPSLSASLFYKEVDLLQPIAFNKIFDFQKFNTLCRRFVWLGRYSELSNQTEPFELLKGSGRKWTKERDLNQLKECRTDKADSNEVIRIVGKHPFLWHDHWSVKDYAEIFGCLELISDLDNEVAKVVSKIREAGSKARTDTDASRSELYLDGSSDMQIPYMAIHVRIEKDWMIHCKKLEQRSSINEICSSKEEIMERVSRVMDLQKPVVVYLAVADSLLENNSLLSGWNVGLIPYEKKRLGVWDIYNKYPYLVQSAIDFEVCLRADVFVGNSFSTFSSLVVLSRTQKLVKLGVTSSCSGDVRLSSYAYNILGDAGGPRRWMTDMSAPSLQSISYGTNNISCSVKTLD